MYWHIDTDIVSLIIIGAILVYYRKLVARDGSFLRDRRFLHCLIVGCCVTVIDIAASVVMEVPVGNFIYHLFMTLYFVCIEFVIVEWFLYVITIIFPRDDRPGRIVGYTVLGIYLLYAVFALHNPWTGWIYSLGPNGEYYRGPLFAVMLILFMLYTLALFILILVRWKHIPEGYPGGVLLATPAVTAVGITVQLLVPGYLMIMPAYMICLVFAFLFLQNMQQKNDRKIVEDLSRVAETDTLTGLYNRTGMETMVQKTLAEEYGQDVLVLITDIDDLKGINDTLGHAGGDQAICAVAGQLRRHFRVCDTVVRYGGDEFLVFLTGTFTKMQLKHSMERLVQELGALRIGPNGDIPLHGSIGAAIGMVGRESFEELCKQADTALYHVKRNGKNACAFYSPEMEPPAPPRDGGTSTA